MSAVQKPSLAEPHHHHHISVFFLLLFLGSGFTVYNLYADVLHDVPIIGHLVPFILLAIALFIALAFEFVNGFHDTANAVATVIYTHSLSPNMAVIWSGIFNFIGVMLSSGIVAYSIIALLPVELILQVGSRAGFAMVFALLLSAILWNLGTWWLGLPASSSHTMVGSIIGIGMANAWIKGNSATAGVDWAHAHKVMVSLLISPLIGFLSAAALLIIAKRFIKNRDLYHAPKGKAPPPFWIRCLLILTCTGVSFAHGSNDGQKGMGLIMLILVGTVPTVYALNKAIPDSKQGQFIAIAQQTEQTLHEYQTPLKLDAQSVLASYLNSSSMTDEVLPAMLIMNRDIANQISAYGHLRDLPQAAVSNVRNEMYLLSESINKVLQEPHLKLSLEQRTQLSQLRKEMDSATKFIPVWVKVSVAISLALGTMIGWRRIVITIGEKIGKSHLTYAQGASAELITMTTIAASDMFGLPVSTTHVLSSGVAGTMVANRSGIHMQTIRNLIAAWVLTMPMAILMSASFYYIFIKSF